MTTIPGIDVSEVLRFAGQRAERFCSRMALYQLTDIQDARQDTVVAVLNALPRYRLDRGEWQSYFAVVVDRRLRWWYHRRRIVRRRFGTEQPRQEPFDFEPACYWYDESGAESLALLRRFVSVLPILPFPLRIICVHLLAGANLAQIGRRLGLSRQAAHARGKRLARLLRELLADDLECP